MDDLADGDLGRRLDAALTTAATPDWDEIERLAQAVGTPRGRSFRPLRPGFPARRRFAAIVACLVVLLVPSAIAVGHLVLETSPPLAAPVHLPRLPPGWTVVTASSQYLRSTGTHVQTLITSWHYRPSEFGPASAIPPGGTMLSVALLRAPGSQLRTVNLCETTAVEPGYPRRTPPLTLPRTTTDTLEGAPHIKEFRVFGRYRSSYDFEVRVDIDTRRPVGPRWHTAERIISGLSFPRWPATENC